MVESRRRTFRRFVGAMLATLFALSAFAAPVGAQYGGITGLFVTTSPDTPGFADFSGLGCAGGHEVVLYFPGLQPTANDPVATQSVPGRILAVTTSEVSADPLLNGTFSFPNVRLPDDVEPGIYEVHSRCGDLDLTVLIQISSDGTITISPDPLSPATNETPGGNNGNSPIPGALPFTGSNSNRFVSLASGLIAGGIAFLALSRRSNRSHA